MSRKALLNSELNRMVDILKEKYHPQKVMVFGSVVSGRIHEWSD